MGRANATCCGSKDLAEAITKNNCNFVFVYSKDSDIVTTSLILFTSSYLKSVLLFGDGSVVCSGSGERCLYHRASTSRRLFLCSSQSHPRHRITYRLGPSSCARCIAVCY